MRRRTRVLRYVVISPDDLPIAPTTYESRTIAEHARDRWCARFAAQGYYAAADGRRIPLAELPARCRIDVQTATRRHWVDDDATRCGVTGTHDHAPSCRYLGNDAWSCGKLDNQPTTEEA